MTAGEVATIAADLAILRGIAKKPTHEVEEKVKELVTSVENLDILPGTVLSHRSKES